MSRLQIKSVASLQTCAQARICAIFVCTLAIAGCDRTDTQKSLALPPVDVAIGHLINVQPVADPQVATDCQRAHTELSDALSQLPEEIRHTPNIVGLRRVDDWLLALDNMSGLSTVYEYLHPDQSVRQQSSECARRLNDLFSDFMLSGALYDALQHIKIARSDQHANRYQDKILREFKLSGANRDQPTRARIRQLRAEILEIGQQYSRNIREDRLSIKVPLDDLTGLPEDYLEHRKQPDSQLIEISTDYPDYQPVMQYAENDALRLRVLKLFLSRARDANTSVLQNLINKRHEIASVLGYHNYAQLTLEDEMIGTPENARAFINEISKIAQTASKKDYQILLDTLRKTQPEANVVGNWQQHYLSNIVRQERFDLDRKHVRTYFRYERVKRGIFQLTRDLFGLKIRAVDAPVWHSDVEAYELYDGQQLLGRFFLDMHPRPNKYQHAAHFGIRTGTQQRQLPMAVLACNFPVDPSHADGAFMEHGQVETFLHEFGHLLHSILGGQQTWSLLSGIATEHDFVEAPSQMLEEWIWDADSLRGIAINDEGEKLPLEIIKKMRQARKFGRGLWVRNQMFYAALSLHYYSEQPSKLDLLEDMVRLQNDYSPFQYVPDTHFYASFGHLYGYAAAYYTYMWSLVIAMDMFSEFEKSGLRDTAMAMRYRRTVLEPGGTQDAAVLVRNFLGRDYNTHAFKHFLTSP